MPSACPVLQREFNRSVNMTAAQIRAWIKDPRAKEASFSATLRRLPHLAKLKAKRSAWNKSDCNYAQRVVNFNTRMSGMVKKWGCKRKAVISLRNWGRQPPKCGIPEKKAKR
jgi:hypothetical protein